MNEEKTAWTAWLGANVGHHTAGYEKARARAKSASTIVLGCAHFVKTFTKFEYYEPYVSLLGGQRY